MNIRKIFQSLLFLVLLSILCTPGCKKKVEKDPASVTQLSKDENDVQNTLDDAINDVNDILSDDASKPGSVVLCGAIIDSGAVLHDSINYFIIYTGIECHDKKKEGTVEVKKKVNQRWEEAGASVQVKLINFKITKNATGRFVKLSGYLTHVNVSGGLSGDLNGSNTVVQTVTGTLGSEFDNGVSKIWKIAKKRTSSGMPNSLIITIEGMGSADGYENLATWGINRHGEQFYSVISTPVVCKQVCEWDPVSGKKTITIPANNKTATITFGYNSSGNPATGSNCPTHCKVEWLKDDKSGTMLHTI